LHYKSGDYPGVKTLFIALDSPWESGYIESFNSKLRDELLDRELFLHIDELRYVADRWRLDYNHYRPHSSLDYMAPAAFAAKCLEDGSTVVVGTGAPCAAAMLAQKTHAPDLVILFEVGGFAPILPTMSISVGDSWAYYKVVTATSMDEIMEACQKGLVDYTFIGRA